MADSDPISEASPSHSQKKRKLLNGASSKVWNSDDDSGSELFDEPETVATVPLKRPFHSSQLHSSQNGQLSYVTQPTQHRTQFSPNYSQDVQVERSSPAASSPPRQPPPPITHAPFAKPQAKTSLLASMAPRGTQVRPPVVRKEVVDIDSDMSDPPVEHSDEDESRGLTSNIRPTSFTRGGRNVNSPQRHTVKESPRAPQALPTIFSSLVSQFKHDNISPQSSATNADHMSQAYGGVSRAPRTQSQALKPSPASLTSGSPYQTINDIHDFEARRKVERIMSVFTSVSVSQAHDALRRKRFNVNDAMEYLSHDDHNQVDDLAPTPYKQSQRKGTAQLVQSSQVRPSAKQAVKQQSSSIASRYLEEAKAKGPYGQLPKEPPRPSNISQPTQESQDDVIPRKGRLLSDRRLHRTPSPEMRTTGRRLQRRPQIVEDEDEDDGSDDVRDEPPESEEEPESTFDQRLLTFFNTCSKDDLMDLSAQPEEDVDFMISKRPFKNLTHVDNIERPAEGKKKRAKPLGEKMLDTCREMLSGYEAVDQLVSQCEKLAKPIQEALKAWGVGARNDGELQIMKLEDQHDSGIGTPSSTYSDHAKKKSSFLSQPSNMGTDLTMKDYQLVGLNWLCLLYKERTSCILADDMGLGKTCQVIAFLAQLKLENVDGIHLIIVPGSTLENWLRELKRFAPTLRFFPYYGSQNERPGLQQELDDHWTEYDVVVTTYDMAVKDHKFIRKLEPAVCVYDEAHVLRNPNSDRYNKLMRITADFKVLLTGTPLQNNLQELTAILAFIMPDMFQRNHESLNHIFKHKGSTKNDHHSLLLSEQRTQRARSMITPFILRRKKAQVLDLPAKHSRVEYCDLTDTQAEMYDGVRDEVQRLFDERAAGVNKIAPKQSSNVLMDLRKAAIHPLLKRNIYSDKKIDKIANVLLKHEEFAGNPKDKVLKYLTGEAASSLNGNDYSLHVFCAERDYLDKYALHNEEWMNSGKVHKFKELVESYVANGDKVLVFSQFTMMMDILEAVMSTLGIKFMRLDGSTNMNDRQTMIDDFNTNEDVSVFMLSTKAGGAGINLASANKVIIFDSGFNPQDDIQAENRAHRVGQTRDVEVIRLVSRDTIEEQIHALGVSKLALDERVAGEGATAAEDEKSGAEAVERMLMESMQKKSAKADVEAKVDEDVKDAFKKGLQSSGLQVD